ncbi:MAG: hypothetical protein J1E98_02345 [Lachnospiraceae bacterium]|nr:hypothetical protein [Lachnospiraceae bacterium]
MEQIVEQLIKLNRRDLLDIVGILLPIVLTVVIIVQDIVHFRRTNELQKQIHNRDRAKQYHDDILIIYNTFYEFCDTIFTSGFSYNVESGNYNLASTWINNLNTLRISIGRNQDLAKLIFGRSNKGLYSIIEDRFSLSTKIIDKYIEYINSGRLFTVSENAWTRVSPQYPTQVPFRYNYVMLAQDKSLYDDFMKLCESEELKEIQTLVKEHKEKHSYDNFDKYFEEYFSLDEL